MTTIAERRAENLTTALAPRTLKVYWADIDLKGLSAQVRPALDTVRAALETARAAIDVAAVVVQGAMSIAELTVDLVALALRALVEALEALMEFFIATNIGFTWYYPTCWREIKNTAQLFQILASSMLDESDPQRPLGTSESNHVLMVNIFAAAPTVKVLWTLFSRLAALFDLELPEQTQSSSSLYERFGWPPQVPAGGHGQAPDWQTYRLADIPPFKQWVSTLWEVREEVRPAQDYLVFIRKLLEMVDLKISQVLQTLNDILDVINGMVEALGATGIHIAVLEGQGSVLSQTLALRAAPEAGDYPFRYTLGTEVSAVLSMHLQAGTGGAIDAFKTMLGLVPAAIRIETSYNQTVSETKVKAGEVTEQGGKVVQKYQETEAAHDDTPPIVVSSERGYRSVRRGENTSRRMSPLIIEGG